MSIGKLKAVKYQLSPAYAMLYPIDVDRYFKREQDERVLNFIIENTDYVDPLTISRREDMHSLLVKNLEVDRNLRQRRVGISGTNYLPLDNEHQIRDAVNELCLLINSKQNVFEKELLALVMLSYIQPSVDGNKRTARIISNALLIANQY